MLQVGSKGRPRGSKLSGKGLQGGLGEHQGGFRTAFEGQNMKTTIFNIKTCNTKGVCFLSKGFPTSFLAKSADQVL